MLTGDLQGGCVKNGAPRIVHTLAAIRTTAMAANGIRLMRAEINTRPRDVFPPSAADLSLRVQRPSRASGIHLLRWSAAIASTLLLLAALSPRAFAQTKAPFELRWPHEGQTLIYGSDGCADECWYAEVRRKRSHRVLARLYCDGATLTLARSGNAEARVVGRCDDINEDGVRGIKSKFDAIPEILERLMQGRER